MSDAEPKPSPATSLAFRGRVGLIVLLIIFLAADSYAFVRARADQSTLLEATRLFNSDAQFSDWIFKQQAARGNLTVQLQGFDPFASDQRYLMYRSFIRGAYLIYPKRIYLGDDATPVGLGFQANPFPSFSPSATWEVQHGIKTRLTIILLPDGQHETYSMVSLP